MNFKNIFDINFWRDHISIIMILLLFDISEQTLKKNRPKHSLGSKKCTKNLKNNIKE